MEDDRGCKILRPIGGETYCPGWRIVHLICFDSSMLLCWSLNGFKGTQDINA